MNQVAGLTHMLNTIVMLLTLVLAVGVAGLATGFVMWWFVMRGVGRVLDRLSRLPPAVPPTPGAGAVVAPPVVIPDDVVLPKSDWRCIACGTTWERDDLIRRLFCPECGAECREVRTTT